MNKTELVKKIADAAGLTAADAKKALDATTDAIKEALVAGEKVQLVGFGTFATKVRPARQGVNPSNGTKIQIPERTVVKFNPGAEFEEAVNK
jgi:DNA-binding protein HU-beta